MKSSLPVCPIPTEQQPLNEFEELKESWYYSWATRSLSSYIKPIVILWVINWAIAGPVAAVSFPWSKYPGQFVLSAAAGAAVLPTLALIRLYSGWVYIRNRLAEETVFYEESGWYDGQTWTKPNEVLQRDRLIVTYQVQPILKRLHRTFAAIAGLGFFVVVAWNIL